MNFFREGSSLSLSPSIPFFYLFPGKNDVGGVEATISKARSSTCGKSRSIFGFGEWCIESFSRNKGKEEREKEEEEGK